MSYVACPLLTPYLLLQALRGMSSMETSRLLARARDKKLLLRTNCVVTSGYSRNWNHLLKTCCHSFFMACACLPLYFLGHGGPGLSFDGEKKKTPTENYAFKCSAQCAKVLGNHHSTVTSTIQVRTCAVLSCLQPCSICAKKEKIVNLKWAFA